MAATPRLGQARQHEYADALAPARAVRPVGERLAPAVRGQAPLPRERVEGVGGGHDRHAAREGHVAFAAPQCLRRQVERHQGRRARRVHGQRRALQPQDVGDPPGQHAADGSGERVVLASFE
ncbi:hypothetical protein Save01_02230 [Streptomyces avermitilis]